MVFKNMEFISMLHFIAPVEMRGGIVDWLLDYLTPSLQLARLFIVEW